MSYEYRIEYSIQRCPEGTDSFVEIGFGSSGTSGTVDRALYAIQSDVQNRLWEATEGMPDPETVDQRDD